MKRYIIIVLALCGILFNACAGNQPQAVEPMQAEYTQQDVARFEEAMALLDEVPSLSAPEMMVKTALSFLGTPYEAGLLEHGQETLLIETSKTDCILFVEMCLALVETYRSGDRTFDRFARETAALRYRAGAPDGYASRLHYTSEWIAKAEGRGVLKEITAETGGEPLDQTFSFMSTHPDSYRQLKEDPSLVEEIAAIESTLSEKGYSYVPKAEISKNLANIHTGDIVCFTSTVKGLDIAHLGIAYWQDGKLTFIHASTTANKVIINEKPLVDYTNGVRSQSGLRILRIF